MLIGLIGPNAIGKTTFLNSYMCRHADDSFRRVRFVFADLDLDYKWDVRQHRWVDHRRPGEVWRPTSDKKADRIDDMVADDGLIWVLDSARYFTGMYETLVEVHERYDGGMAFLIPVTRGEIMKIFIRDRCQDKNKTFSEDYWADGKRADYEAGPRYDNAATKWFTPNHIPWCEFQIERDRTQFSAVGDMLTSYIQQPVHKWYGVRQRWQEYMEHLDGRRARS